MTSDSQIAACLDLVIRHAIPADAERLAVLAARTFSDTFAANNKPEDMAIHLARSYSLSIQLAEINDPGMRTLLVEIAGAAVAYAQLRSWPQSHSESESRHRPRTDEAPSCVAGPNPCEIWRFYVDRPWLGRGVAQRLMSATIDEARTLGAQTLWLGVWERNPRAIAFYRKCGFAHVGKHGFLFANEMQTDLVMARRI